VKTYRTTWLASIIGILMFVPASHAQSAGTTQIWPAKIAALNGCPVTIVRAQVANVSSGLSLGNLTLRNDSGANVTVWAVRYMFKMSDGTQRSVYVLQPEHSTVFGVGEQTFSSIPKTISASGPNFSPNASALDAVAELEYVATSDGRTWANDSAGVVAQMLAQVLTMQTEKQRLLSVYRQQGERALLDALAAQAAPGDPPETAGSRQALLKTYQRNGLNAVLSVLQAPHLGGMLVKVRLDQ